MRLAMKFGRSFADDDALAEPLVEEAVDAQHETSGFVHSVRITSTSFM